MVRSCYCLPSFCPLRCISHWPLDQHDSEGPIRTSSRHVPDRSVDALDTVSYLPKMDALMDISISSCKIPGALNPM